jgi:hypothetical protein
VSHFGRLAWSRLQVAGRNLELAEASAPVVGAEGGERIYRRRLLVKGIEPDFCEEGEALVPFFPAVVAWEEGTWVDGAVASSSRPTMEARGLQSIPSSLSSLSRGRGMFL